MNKPERPILAVTMGDPAGIGPEVAVRACARPSVRRFARPLIFGDPAVIRRAAEITGVTLPIVAIPSPDRASFRKEVVEVIDCAAADLSGLEFGKVQAAAGQAAYNSIVAAIHAALEGTVDGTVTAPVHKEALKAAGVRHPGHTEIYGALTGTRDYAMMLADGDFRVVHVSTHVSLRKACDRATEERVYRTIRLAQDAMLRLGIRAPRIGVAGLNPHAGEGGLFGDEEILHIAPAIRRASAEGIDADGPLPPDSAFARARGGQYDIMVAMYHDQGHIPIKTAGFLMDRRTGRWKAVSGINVTLGLPIVRTSVDHGTAFDQAGHGTASDRSMVEAIRYAAMLSRPREGIDPLPAHSEPLPSGTACGLRTLLADDLTGAMDTGVQTAVRSDARVFCVWDPDRIGGVPADATLLFDTESRNLGDGAAAEAMNGAIRSLRSAGRRIDYKKIDSTMRGPVISEIRTLLDTGGHPGVLICPALPGQGRIVRDGVLYLDGVPISETDIGQDPLAPFTASSLTDFLSDAGLPAVLVRDADGLRGGMDKGFHVFVGDAVTNRDLRNLAEAASGSGLLPVGSAGLASVWPMPVSSGKPGRPVQVSLPAPLVFVNGSPASRTLVQIGRLLSDAPDIAVIHPSREDLVAPDGDSRRQIALQDARSTIRKALSDGRDILLNTAHLPKEDILAAEGDPETVRLHAGRILRSLADLAGSLGGAGTLVLLGGDTAFTLLQASGADALEILGPAQPQIPFGIVRGGRWDRMSVVTKAGGFGDPDTLVRLLAMRS